MRRAVLLLASVALALLLASGMAMIETVGPAQAAYPGANGKIVVREYDDNEGDYGLKRINPNGSNVTTLLEYSGYTPAISPDGTWVAYMGGEEIYKYNFTNRRVTQITNNNVSDSNPTWSPDGTRIAFERDRTVDGVTNRDIFVRRADGTGKSVNKTKSPNESEYAPAWSPKGNEIAFHTATTQDVVVLNLDTGQIRNLTNDGTARRDYTPNWSPDGTRIVFESYALDYDPETDIETASERIYTMNASDGSDRQLLVEAFTDMTHFEGGSYFSGTTYSPDGKKIAYAQNSWYDVYKWSGLYKMNASDGSNKQLLYGAGNGQGRGRIEFNDPDWGVKAPPPEPCTITGTKGDDELEGTSRSDIICGLGGNDGIAGRGGDDILRGGDGNDGIQGGSGVDKLFGEEGADGLNTTDGVESNDAMNGGGGTDACRGDQGDTETSCEAS